MQEQGDQRWTAATGQRRRRGRLAAAETRDIHFSVRLTRSERDALNELAGIGGIAELLRAAAFRRAARLRVRVPELNREAWAELARTAANLNQLSHAANAGRIISSEELAPVLVDLGEQVAALRSQLITPTEGGENVDA